MVRTARQGRQKKATEGAVPGQQRTRVFASALLILISKGVEKVTQIWWLEMGWPCWIGFLKDLGEKKTGDSSAFFFLSGKTPCLRSQHSGPHSQVLKRATETIFHLWQITWGWPVKYPLCISAGFQNHDTSTARLSWGEEQLPETVFVFFLGDRGKHGLASRHLCFHQLAILQAYTVTVSSVRREKSIKKKIKKKTISCLQEANSRLFLGSEASICQSGSGRFLSQFLAKSLTHSNWESRRTLRMGTQKCQGAKAWLQAALRLWHTQWRGGVMNCDPKRKVK